MLAGENKVNENLLLKWTDLNAHLLSSYVKEGDIVVDATMGNGNDTLMLARLVGKEGSVYAFDIQKQAIENTQQLLASHLMDQKNIHLIEDSHVKIEEYIHDEIAAAVFNLGYLPKGSHELTTKVEDSIIAIQLSLKLLRKNGIISIVLYSGHADGSLEKEKIIEYTKNLDNKKYHCVLSESINQKNSPPAWMLITKR